MLEHGGRALLLDCGLPAGKIKAGLGYDVAKAEGACVTHAHADHAMGLGVLEAMGIPALAPWRGGGTAAALGEYAVRAFPLDGPDGTPAHTNADGSPCPCYGFLVDHPAMGRLAYATDAEYVRWRFRGVSHMLLGCDYQLGYLEGPAAKRAHVLRGHMELATAAGFVAACRSPALLTVTLCHMGGSADPGECEAEIRKAAGPGVRVRCARPGEALELPGGGCPF